MRRYCSVPEWGNLRKWFEKNFHHPCEFHDELYEEAEFSRLACDVILIGDMLDSVEDKTWLSKVLVYWPVTLLAFVGVRCVGWLSYGKK